MAVGDYPEFKDKFYTEMWHTWAQVSYKDPTNIVEVCNQRIANNSSIRVILTDK
jgi:hypothetical protein